MIDTGSSCRPGAGRDRGPLFCFFFFGLALTSCLSGPLEPDGSAEDAGTPLPEDAGPRVDGGQGQDAGQRQEDAGHDAGPGPYWVVVPLATAAERDAGRAGGEFGQMVFSLTVCKEDPNYLAMALDTAPVYISENGGKTWELRRNGIRSNGAQSVAFDPANKHVLWAAGLRSLTGSSGSSLDRASIVDAGARNFGPQDGLYRSTDLGHSWVLLHRAGYYRWLAQNEYFAFAPGPRSASGSSTVYAITHEEGLLKTTDFGASWSGNLLPEKLIGNAVVYREPGWLWLAADEGLWLSTNGGADWTPRRLGAINGLVVHPLDPRIVFVALPYQSSSNRGVWRTTNAGDTWEEANGAADGGSPLPRGATPWLWSWGKLAMSPISPNALYVAASASWLKSPYVTLDQGAHWQPWVEKDSSLLYGTAAWLDEGLAVHPEDPTTAFHVAPFRRTTDSGRSWHLFGDGVSGARRHWRTSIAFHPQDPARRLFFHTDTGAALTTNGGYTWVRVAPPQLTDGSLGCCGGTQTQPGGALDPTPGSRRVISAAGNWVNQRLMVSDREGLNEADGGTSWKAIQRPGDGGLYFGNYRFFAWHPQAPTVVYVGTATGGLRSSDRGETWTELDRPILAMSQGNGDIVYSAHPGGPDAGNRYMVERSVDRGATWAMLGSPLSIAVRDLDVDPLDADRVYAAASDAVRGAVYVSARSQDGGIVWTARGADAGLSPDAFGGSPFRMVAVDPRRPQVVYVGQGTGQGGAGKGVFRSTDRGETWVNINRNLGADLSLWSITVDPVDSAVWLGTDYGNIRGAAE